MILKKIFFYFLGLDEIKEFYFINKTFHFLINIFRLLSCRTLFLRRRAYHTEFSRGSDLIALFSDLDGSSWKVMPINFFVPLKPLVGKRSVL